MHLLEPVPLTKSNDKILVVEDDTNIRRILQIQLEADGYTVIQAEDGQVALDILQRETPDLVLLDVMMPNADGFTVCRKIRENPRHIHLPVIFLTAKISSQERLDGLMQGANDYVTKPYEREELLARVKNMIAWSRAQRHSSPLTGLPGNITIERELEKRLSQSSDFDFLYLDLDHFKAFNDFYSYRAGDAVIRLLATILQSVISEDARPDDFVGHVGGDDFVVITTPGRGRGVAEAVIQRWDKEILEHYSPEDRERGYIKVEDRQGEGQEFPFVGITIALVESGRTGLDHIARLNDLVADLKKRGKQEPRSILVEDRRDSGQIRKIG